MGIGASSKSNVESQDRWDIGASYQCCQQCWKRYW